MNPVVFGTFFWVSDSQQIFLYNDHLQKNGDRMIRTNPTNTENQKYMVSFQVKFPN